MMTGARAWRQVFRAGAERHRRNYLMEAYMAKNDPTQLIDDCKSAVQAQDWAGAVDCCCDVLRECALNMAGGGGAPATAGAAAPASCPDEDSCCDEMKRLASSAPAAKGGKGVGAAAVPWDLIFTIGLQLLQLLRGRLAPTPTP